MKIGIPVLNRGDLLEKLVHSVDIDAQVIVVVNRIGPIDPSVERAVNQLERTPPPNIEIDILRVDGNLGVSGSWNYLLDRFAGNCIIANSDIEFTPGALKDVREQVVEQRHIVLQHLFTWSCFYATGNFTRTLGWFDENLYPAYHEDQEMSARAALLNVQRCGFRNLTGRVLHGGSQTIKGATGGLHKFLRLATGQGEGGQMGSALIYEYFNRRWGPLPLQKGTSLPNKDHPFDNRALRPYDWTLDLAFRKRITQMAEEITGHPCPIVYHRCEGGLAGD